MVLLVHSLVLVVLLISLINFHSQRRENCYRQVMCHVYTPQIPWIFFLSKFLCLVCLQDVYLHTNCLATLANMAPHVHRLDAYASQRLVSLFHMLSRKYAILLSSILYLIFSVNWHIWCMLYACWHMKFNQVHQVNRSTKWQDTVR